MCIIHVSLIFTCSTCPPPHDFKHIIHLLCFFKMIFFFFFFPQICMWSCRLIIHWSFIDWFSRNFSKDEFFLRFIYFLNIFFFIWLFHMTFIFIWFVSNNPPPRFIFHVIFVWFVIWTFFQHTIFFFSNDSCIDLSIHLLSQIFLLYHTLFTQCHTVFTCLHRCSYSAMFCLTLNCTWSYVKNIWLCVTFSQKCMETRRLNY